MAVRWRLPLAALLSCLPLAAQAQSLQACRALRERRDALAAEAMQAEIALVLDVRRRLCPQQEALAEQANANGVAAPQAGAPDLAAPGTASRATPAAAPSGPAVAEPSADGGSTGARPAAGPPFPARLDGAGPIGMIGPGAAATAVVPKAPATPFLQAPPLTGAAEAPMAVSGIAPAGPVGVASVASPPELDYSAYLQCRRQAERLLQRSRVVLYTNQQGFLFYTAAGARLARQADQLRSSWSEACAGSTAVAPAG